MTVGTRWCSVGGGSVPEGGTGPGCTPPYPALPACPGYTFRPRTHRPSVRHHPLVVRCPGRTPCQRPPYHSLGKVSWSHYPAQSCPDSSRVGDRAGKTLKDGIGQCVDSRRSGTPIITLEVELCGESPIPAPSGCYARARVEYHRFTHFYDFAR